MCLRRQYDLGVGVWGGVVSTGAYLLVLTVSLGAQDLLSRCHGPAAV